MLLREKMECTASLFSRANFVDDDPSDRINDSLRTLSLSRKCLEHNTLAFVGLKCSLFAAATHRAAIFGSRGKL